MAVATDQETKALEAKVEEADARWKEAAEIAQKFQQEEQHARLQLQNQKKKVMLGENVNRGNEIERLAKLTLHRQGVRLPCKEAPSLRMLLKVIYSYVFVYDHHNSDQRLQPVDWNQDSDAAKWDRAAMECCNFRNNECHSEKRDVCTQEEYEDYYEYLEKRLSGTSNPTWEKRLFPDKMWLSHWMETVVQPMLP